MELQSDATVFFNIESYDNNDEETVIESNWEINRMVTRCISATKLSATQFCSTNCGFLENTLAIRFHPLPTEDDQQPHVIKIDVPDDMLPRTFLILLRESMEDNKNNVITYTSHVEGIEDMNRIIENNEEIEVEELNEAATESLYFAEVDGGIEG
jgi:hypothetical protein